MTKKNLVRTSITLLRLSDLMDKAEGDWDFLEFLLKGYERGEDYDRED